nr:UGT95 [Lysionotus pauciflorus]
MAAKMIDLVFIPFTAPSHFAAFVKLAKLLTDTDERISVTMLMLKTPVPLKVDLTGYSRIRCVQIIPKEPSTPEAMGWGETALVRVFASQKEAVRHTVAEIIEDPTKNVAGFVMDVFCAAATEVADEFRVPSYVFFTSGAAVLGLALHFQKIRQEFGPEHLVAQLEAGGADLEFSISTFVNPFPARALPSSVYEKGIGLLVQFGYFKNCKGIMLNTFLELESHALKTLLAEENFPNIYPIGPMSMVGPSNKEGEKKAEILEWLDHQPDSSVVFICFGTNGSFDIQQVKEIATALEKSGHRFLWSLRKPPPEGKFELVGEYQDPGEVLPEGFLQRTSGVGRVIGWAPQMAVLSHPSVGGFVSHCGWNSALESVYCGVPMAVWPLYAEQPANSFLFVKELGIAVEIMFEYRRGCGKIVGAEKIEKAIRELMDPDNEIRVKIKAMQEKCKITYDKGGPSRDYLERLIQEFVQNVS